MKQNKLWGSDVCSSLANPTALKIVKHMMEINEMPTLKNGYAETDFISSEEFILTEGGDFFSKKTAHERTPNMVEFYESLAKNGEYLRFAYRPFLKDGTFENIVFKHHDESGKEVFCKEYFDHEITEMLKTCPDHILVKAMNRIIEVFNSAQTQKKDSSTETKQKI